MSFKQHIIIDDHKLATKLLLSGRLIKTNKKKELMTINLFNITNY